MERVFEFSIDRGGTFTDVFCNVGGKKQRVIKLLSEDPSNYRDAPTEGIRRILEMETGIEHPPSKLIDTSRIKFIRMGTTVATNALLERKGQKTALVITKGFRDLLVIGNQSRPKIFDLDIKRPDVVYDWVEEIDERVVLLKPNEYICDPTEKMIGVSQDSLCVEKNVNENEVREKLLNILRNGIESIAVVFMHSYTYPHHEQFVKRIALEMGFKQISLSSDIMPMVRIVPRGSTTCVDAYLTPVIKTYLHSFCSGFDENLKDVSISFMQSDGGLTPMSSFLGNRAILSGPAGGVVGYARTSIISLKLTDGNNNSQTNHVMPAIGFDMGGTSTDVSRYAGSFEQVFETTTAGITIQSRQLDINTVAAGGGSRLFYRNKIFVVGPESVGAHPGPVCYRKNGQLAVTDANLFLGRIQPDLFPCIFGPHENQPLDLEATTQAFALLCKQINDSRHNDSNVATNYSYTMDEIVYGFIKVTNEAMARPIRNLTTMKGYDVTKHVLACFGGAGPQHCCAIAKILGMSRVVVHRHSGILSAYGLSLADIVEERQEPYSGLSISSSSYMQINERLTVLKNSGCETLLQQGFSEEAVTFQCFLNCRYAGTDTGVMTPVDISITCGDIDIESKVKEVVDTFCGLYRREYGFELQHRAILVDDLRVRAVGKSSNISSLESTEWRIFKDDSSYPIPPDPHYIASVYFENGRLPTPVYLLKQFTSLRNELTNAPEVAGVIHGPAIIVQDVATVVVEPNCTAYVSTYGDIDIIIHESKKVSISAKVADPIYLSIFAHRFMGIAEQMGRTLQRTSISVNIKERLDFSCALFDSLGGLVANAPHLPVHLGAMSEAVRYQVRHWNDNNCANGGIQDGDVLVSNHPQLAGGSHLPDITVITPIFCDGKIVFFVASRGHHADVGGIAPGSMPPLSKTLVEEGAAIVAFKLVQNNVFQETGVTELLQAPGKLPGNYGTRNLSDNISDLRAQVAANHRGKLLIDELVKEYSLEVVQGYMTHIQKSAECAVRDMLREFYIRKNLDQCGSCVTSEDYLDDGSLIRLKVEIDKNEGSAIFDFTGTGHEIYGNLNAPPAVTTSAIIYCLRCLLPEISDLPLNQGCLEPITIKLPVGSMLHPSPTAAVVGGNVLTSQRVTDVILRAFEACAASQGCMNNLTFGDDTMGYYETIAGGSGAGPGYCGISGVHTHMTNTRITDPEILERRYPVLLRRFGLRECSGGDGKFVGGDGVVREMEFLRNLTVSILSERRSFQPYGMSGGKPGERGVNLLYISGDTSSSTNAPATASGQSGGKVVNLGGKNTVQVKRYDRLTILSPGGGGYGTACTGSSDGEDQITEGGNNVNSSIPIMTAGSLHAYTLSQESA